MPASNRRVLVVEDDQSIGELLSTVLVDEGYEVRLATGGRQALGLVDAWRPNLILLDLTMNDMDGWTFRNEQERHGLADVPVLVLTGATDPEAQARALSAPVLLKPFLLDELLQSVERLVN